MEKNTDLNFVYEIGRELGKIEMENEYLKIELAKLRNIIDRDKPVKDYKSKLERILHEKSKDKK